MKRALIVFGAWSAVAVLFSIQMRFQTSPGAEQRPWGWIFAWQFSGWWTWALFTAPVCAFSAWAVRIRRPARVIASHVPVAVLTAVACAGFEGGLKWALGLWRTPHTFLSGVRDGIALWWTFNVLVYAMVAGLYHAWRAARLEMQLVQARLDALVGQLQPHFLFNTLHTISAFVLEDPKQANRMITRLSELLRQSFNRERGPLVTLEEELELLDHYVAIQEARFGDRLRVTFRVDPRAAAAAVPTLLLQPLVENAIRYGVAPNGGIAEVEIAATREGDRLHLAVRDNGPGLNGGGGGGREGIGGMGGLGIANTRARLLELYGPSYRFELTNAPAPGGALATIEIPYSEHARHHR
ncbi:MAG TPA: histidine kinase [Gemmatimonadales bacterium]|jgi:signal transduction histidine kinase|nr:histidine kinase [Gemmatimonadales bacterium]